MPRFSLSRGLVGMACVGGGWGKILRLNVTRLSQTAESLDFVFGDWAGWVGADRGGGCVDGLPHHVQGREGVESRCGGSVFVTEETHDDRQRNALLVEVHGFGLTQHVAVDVLRDRRALCACGRGG